MMSRKLQAIRGMNDILPDDARRWLYLEDVLRFWLEGYGYDPIRTPIVEATELFSRGVGEATDIVEKEMYAFTDALNGENLTLRPEGTAACVRAVVEHHLLHDGPQRLWYMGPMFRHERPQKGRYRQFHQLGVEAFGYPGPDIDVEQILMCQRLWEILGVADSIRLEINSLGQPEERAAHRAALIEFFEKHIDSLDETSRARLRTNPLRILDSKHETTRQIAHEAPLLTDYLGDDSLRHFDVIQSILNDFGLDFTVNSKLVRGLDYYNLTVYEFITDKLGAQGTLCGGGRYDGLIETLGGKPSPACGFAIGLERLLALVEVDEADATRPCDVYVTHHGRGTLVPALDASEILRDHGLDVIMHCGEANFKNQMRKADESGAQFALLIGEEEAEAGTVTLKPLRDDIEQVSVPIDDLMTTIEEMREQGETDHGGNGS